MKTFPRPCDVTGATATYLDCCLPDYFQGGDYAEILAVPMWHGVTYREAYEAAKDEFHASSGYFDNVSGSGTLVETALHGLFAAMLAEDTDKPADFARYIEPDQEGSGETVYLYIGIDPTTREGPQHD